MTTDPLPMQDPAVETGPGPRPFAEIPSLWLQVFKMDEDFFASELPRASATNVVLSILVMAAVSALISTVISLFQEAISLFAGFCGGLVGGLIGFYLSAGVIFVGARIFGGKGDFGGQTYLQSLFFVPLGIVQFAVTLIPYVGIVLSVIVSIYGLVLAVRAIKVSHKLTAGRAVGALFLPSLLVLVILPICVISILLLLGPAIGEVFEEIINTI